MNSTQQAMYEEIVELRSQLEHYSRVIDIAIKERNEARRLARKFFNSGGPFMLGHQKHFIEMHPWLEEK